MIEVFKLCKGFDDIPFDAFFKLNSNSLRGHGHKLFKKRFNTNIGKFSFSNRVVDVWNRLPLDVVSCNTVACFKVNLDRLFKEVWGLICL